MVLLWKRRLFAFGGVAHVLGRALDAAARLLASAVEGFARLFGRPLSLARGERREKY
jgi:hypothetical protein